MKIKLYLYTKTFSSYFYRIIFLFKFLDVDFSFWIAKKNVDTSIIFELSD